MGMTTEELGILFGGISSILAVLIYFTKNIKQSSCCGSECKQTVLDGNGQPVRSTISQCDPVLATFPDPQPTIIYPHQHPRQAIV